MEQEPQPLNTIITNQPKKVNEDVDFKPLFKVDKLIIKYYTSTTNDEPTILSNSIALWKDTKTTKYYLKANFNGTSAKVELT